MVNDLISAKGLTYSKCLILILLNIVLAHSLCAQNKSRARDLGIPFDGSSGPLNGITDVQGVEGGQTISSLPERYPCARERLATQLFVGSGGADHAVFDLIAGFRGCWVNRRALSTLSRRTKWRWG